MLHVVYHSHEETASCTVVQMVRKNVTWPKKKEKKSSVRIGHLALTPAKTHYLLKGVQPDRNSKCKYIFHS